MAEQLLSGLKVVECGNFISVGKVRTSGPLLGGDNEYVFQELLNVSDEEYNKLVEEKVIF